MKKLLNTQIEKEVVDTDVLDQEIRDYCINHPLRGERMVIGMVRSKSDIIIKRSDIRESIIRVDEGSLAIRRAAVTKRIVRLV